MGRYHPGTHESPVICRNGACSAKNAPPSAAEYDPMCWRCGDPLTPEPDVGDEVVVDIVDTDEKGRSVGKTERGLVLFLDREVAALEARVKITDIEETSGQAEVIEAL